MFQLSISQLFMSTVDDLDHVTIHSFVNIIVLDSFKLSKNILSNHVDESCIDHIISDIHKSIPLHGTSLNLQDTTLNIHFFFSLEYIYSQLTNTCFHFASLTSITSFFNTKSFIYGDHSRKFLITLKNLLG